MQRYCLNLTVFILYGLDPLSHTHLFYFIFLFVLNLKVRKSTCHSLRTLTIISAEFSEKALNLLMDVLNDDSMFVRLQALETMLHMATYGLLKVQGTHMHMVSFLFFHYFPK